MQRQIARSVYFSRCTDIFTNLALEDWLYKNQDFSRHHLLMLWRNEPCVVIGRHQNPWLECNFPQLLTIGGGTRLARRNSGGGAVYHDLENLNLTFFTSREEYCRRRNLELISRSLKNSFNINSNITKREDLCIDDSKISGTASKLGRTTAYHHCTLLINSDKTNVSLALKSPLGSNVQTNASTSVRSKIMNLSEINPDISVEKVMEAIISEFRGGEVEIIDAIDETNFPGVSKIKKMFLSDEWRFERTPKFTIFKDVLEVSGTHSICAFLVVEKGRVSDAGITFRDANLSVKNNNLRDLSEVFSAIMEKPFGKGVLDEFEMVACGLKYSGKCENIVANISCRS